jgi:hypothetical protein
MGLIMTLETAIAVAVGAAFACYLVYRWQEAVVDSAIPPAPEPYPVPDAEQETPLNPQAAWPFPTNAKP